MSDGLSLHQAVRQRLIDNNEFPNIPESWGVERLRFLFQESKERNGLEPVGEMLSVSEYRGVIPRDYESDDQKRTDEELENYRVVRPGQLAVNSMWLNHLGLGVSDHLGYVSPAYNVYDISPRLDRRFIHHLMRSNYYLKIYLRYLYGIRPNSFQIKSNDWASIPIIVPDLPTQRAIANFLDRETARIDLLIEKKQRLVALLGEKRSAIVNAAVTDQAGFEGVDGVRLQLRRVVTLRNAKTQFDESFRPYIGLEHIASWTGEIMDSDNAEPEGLVAHFSKGDILFGKLRPYLAKIASPDFKGVCSTEVLVIRPEKRIEGRFLHYTLASSGFIDRVNAATYGAKMPRANWENIGTEIIWVPDHSTQLAIADFLDRETARIEKIQEATQQSIDRLKEYRSALITAAVTGQINVAEWGKAGSNERLLNDVQTEMEH